MIEPPPLASTHFEAPATGGWRVDLYCPGETDLDAVSVALTALLGRPATPAAEPVPEENWVAISQAALPPVSAGRFVVHGSHDRHRIGRRLGAIEIDAGEAFGTAHHATTLGCLLAIDRLAHRRAPRHVLDLGCGSGVLAIAASRVWPQATVIASDIDAVAIEVAVANIRGNGAGSRIRACVATGLAHPRLRGVSRFDLVTANILAGPLMRLAAGLRRAVRPGGRVVLSGILAEQAAQVIATYAATGFRLAARHVHTGWATLMLTRVPDACANLRRPPCSRGPARRRACRP